GAFEAQRDRRFGVCGRPERQPSLLDDCRRRSPPREEPDPALPLPLILDELDAATRVGGGLTRLRTELDRGDQTQSGEKTHKTRASHGGPPDKGASPARQAPVIPGNFSVEALRRGTAEFQAVLEIFHS